MEETTMISLAGIEGTIFLDFRTGGYSLLWMLGWWVMEEPGTGGMATEMYGSCGPSHPFAYFALELKSF